MKNLLEKLTPLFLKAIDRHSLLHNRLLWITKVHYVIFYVGIALLLSMAYTSLHSAPYLLPRAEMLGVVSTFIILIPLGFWIFKQISFSIERNYGKRYPYLDKMRFGLYIVCVMAFLSIPLGTVLMMQYQVAHFVDDETLAQDEKLLNLYNPFFLTEAEINAKIDDIERNIKTQFLLENGYDYNDFHQVIETYEYPQAIQLKIAHMTQDIRYFYNPTAISYHSSYYTEPAKKDYDSEYPDYQIFDEEVWHNKNLHQAYIASYIRLFNKYGGDISLSVDEVMAIRNHENSSVVNMEEYMTHFAHQKYGVRRNIDRISDEKYRWQKAQEDAYQIFSVLFFISFFMSLLLSIYNMVRLKDFIISAVGFMALAIGSAMVSAFINEMFGSLGRNNDSTFFFIVFEVYLMALIQSVRIFTAHNFSMFKSICLILTVFGTPFLIWWLGLINESMSSDYSYHSDEYYMSLIWLGILGFSLFVEPIFRKLFLKIKSLPNA